MQSFISLALVLLALTAISSALPLAERSLKVTRDDTSVSYASGVVVVNDVVSHNNGLVNIVDTNIASSNVDQSGTYDITELNQGGGGGGSSGDDGGDGTDDEGTA